MQFSADIRKIGTLIYRPGGAFRGMLYPLEIRRQYRELASLCRANGEGEALGLLTRQFDAACKRADLASVTGGRSEQV